MVSVPSRISKVSQDAQSAAAAETLRNAKERINAHPCSLPEALLERVIRCSTQEGDFVLDPMAGSGTTLRVSQRLGRGYVGIEQQQQFVDLIRERLAKPLQHELF